jgi:hypothetical protein
MTLRLRSQGCRFVFAFAFLVVIPTLSVAEGEEPASSRSLPASPRC